ncbi:MAG: hypothetical protein AAB880_00625, partial [Patescibacteria group bacterium]
MIGDWLLKQTTNLKHLFTTKSFQRISAGSLIALLLVFTLSQDSVRASFYDWSAEAVKSVSTSTRQAASAISRTALNLASNAQTQSSVMLEAVRNRTADSIQFLNQRMDSIARQGGGLQNDITSSLASISLPSFSLPHLSLPSLPDINLPSLPSLPSFSLPDINLPNPISLLSQAYSSLQGASFRLFSQVDGRLAVMLEAVRNRTGDSIHLNSKLDSIASVIRLGRTPSLQNDNSNIATTTTQGLVAGDTTSSPLALATTPPQPLLKEEGTSSFLSSLLSPLKQSFSFLNPSSPSSLLSRLSGGAIEIGQSISESTKYGLNSITTFSSNINLSKILQPAGSFMARVFPTPRTYS